MGFDALFSDLVTNLQEDKENLKEKVQILSLQSNIQYDHLLLEFVYPDCFTFWSHPTSSRCTKTLRFASRVITV